MEFVASIFSDALPNMLSKRQQFCSRLPFLLIVCPERGEGYKGWDRQARTLKRRKIRSIKDACYEQYATEHLRQMQRWLVEGGGWGWMLFLLWFYPVMTPLLEVGRSYGSILRLMHKHNNSHLWIYLQYSLHGSQNPQWSWRAFTSDSLSERTLLLKSFWC